MHMYNKKNRICNLHWRWLDDDDLSCSAEIRDDSPMLQRCSRRSDAPTMLTTLRLATGPVFGPTSEILVLLTPTEQHAHGRLFLETVWLFLLTSNLVASSFHQLAGRCRQRRMSNFWLGDETAVPLCTLVPTSSLVRLSAAPNTEFVDLRLYDGCFLPEYQLDLFDSPPTCWVSTEAARPLQRHTWLACRSQRVQFLVRWWTARPKQAMTSLVPVAMVPSPRPLVSHRTRRAMGSRGGGVESPVHWNHFCRCHERWTIVWAYQCRSSVPCYESSVP